MVDDRKRMKIEDRSSRDIDLRYTRTEHVSFHQGKRWICLSVCRYKPFTNLSLPLPRTFYFLSVLLNPFIPMTIPLSSILFHLSASPFLFSLSPLLYLFFHSPAPLSFLVRHFFFLFRGNTFLDHHKFITINICLLKTSLATRTPPALGQACVAFFPSTAT